MGNLGLSEARYRSANPYLCPLCRWGLGSLQEPQGTRTICTGKGPGNGGEGVGKPNETQVRRLGLPTPEPRLPPCFPARYASLGPQSLRPPRPLRSPPVVSWAQGSVSWTGCFRNLMRLSSTSQVGGLLPQALTKGYRLPRAAAERTQSLMREAGRARSRVQPFSPLRR